MKRVYICAPLSDNPNQDVINAVRFGEYAMKECGAAPVVPHFYILMTNPQSDKETEQRKLADFSLMNCGYLGITGRMKWWKKFHEQKCSKFQSDIILTIKSNQF